MPPANDDNLSTNGGGAGGSSSSGTEISLTRLLQAADLMRYESQMREVLRLRHAGDLQDVDEVDLSGIGMSRPEQKRLRKEYTRMFGVFGKLKRVFSRTESADSRREAPKEADADQHVIPLERITLCKELGKGEFGAVWQASWKVSATENMQVAVKCVSPDKYKLMSSSSSFLQEAAIMTRMRHEHVVRLYGVVLDTKKVMMVSELAMCGSLLECLQKTALRDSFPVHVLCDYAEQIAKGMAYLESQRLIHRDLAARNVLVFSSTKVKISDFGLSRSLGVGEDYYRSEFTPTLKLPIAWCAPECINFLKFTSASDVWAYGVTLWEMFTYGQMPWNGMTGAQILQTVDRERRVMERPPLCPEEMYETMMECWTHDPQERPSFVDIVAVFPERLPQTVRAVCDSKEAAPEHLQFKKDDLILVIHRSPAMYPDGFYWIGTLRNGRSGLFRPTDTVAHLGAEIPTGLKNSLSTGCVGGIVEKEKNDKKNAKKEKERERERKKALISEPVGQVRHTCHVGIDGSAFGLHQLDKKDLGPVSVSPTSNHSALVIPTGNGTISPSMISGPVHLRDLPAREGLALRETMSMRDIGPLRDPVTLRDHVSPPRYRAPSQPPLANHQKTASTTSSIQLSPPNRGTSISPSAPPLTASAAASLERNLSAALAELNSTTASSQMTSLSDEDSGGTLTRNGGYTQSSHHHQKPISAVYARTPARDFQSSPIPAGDVILCDEVRHLERDLTDFSLSSLDFSDTRPLISVSSNNSLTRLPLPSITRSSTVSPSPVRVMTDDELNKWKDRQNREHRKAESQLTAERKKLTVDTRREEDNEEQAKKSFSAGLQAKQNDPNEWSAEAQEAYKLLVECGTSLKETSPAQSMSPTPSGRGMEWHEKRITVIERQPASPIPPPRPVTPPYVKEREKIDEEESVESYSPVKRIHIIETKLLDGPARDLSPLHDRPPPPGLPPRGATDKPPSRPPKTRQVPVQYDARSVYDNLNGVGAGKTPPPVPPKPKVGSRPPSASPPPSANILLERDSPGFAPSIARSTLFTSNKKDDVIKF